MRSIVRIAALLLMAGFLGCGGSTAVKEPEQFAPMPDPKSMSGKDGNLKPLGSQPGNKMTAPLKK